MTTSDGVSSSGLYGFKNRIINGAMVIDQRNAGTQYSPSGTGDSYTLDRYAVQRSVTGKFTVQQNANSVTPPTGYKNYLGKCLKTGDLITFNQNQITLLKSIN